MSGKKLIQSHCDIFGGEYIQGKWGAGPYMVIPYKNWELIFDYYMVSTGQSSVEYTRLRSVYVSKKPYKLKISKEGFFAKIEKAFGGKDIEIGDELFDAMYMIKSNDELMTTRLLNDFDIKSRIDFKKSFSFDIVEKNTMGIKCVEGELGLFFCKVGRIKHEAEILNLIELFQKTLDKLVDLDMAYESKPGSELYKAKV
jgi:hypothetical protein